MNSGTRLGDFEIEEKIGEGSVGEVYRAREVATGRVVALKVLSAQLSANRDYLERFADEASRGVGLQHPNLAAIHGAGDQDGKYFIALEYLPGDTLARWVTRDGKLPQSLALQIALCAAAALKHAWDAEKLAHRSVRPENVMVDAEGNVKLLDMGLAKDWTAESAPNAKPEVFDALNYRAPEVTRPSQPAEPLADIYSLGMTLWFALTGKTPFEAKTWADVMARRLTEPLPDPREAAPETSEFVSRMLERMLAKNPADRHQSWDAVLRDLQLLLDGRPLESKPLAAGASTLQIKISSAPPQPVPPPSLPSLGKLSSLKLPPNLSAPSTPAATSTKFNLKLPSSAPSASPQPTLKTPTVATPKLKLKIPTSAQPPAETPPAAPTEEPAAPKPRLKLKIPDASEPAQVFLEAQPPSSSEDSGQESPPVETLPQEIPSAEIPPEETAGAAEAPTKRSWTLPIIALVVMLGVIGAVPWVLVKMMRRHAPPVANEGEENPDGPLQGTKTPPPVKLDRNGEAQQKLDEAQKFQEAFPAAVDKLVEMLQAIVKNFADTPAAGEAKKVIDDIAAQKAAHLSDQAGKVFPQILTLLLQRDYLGAQKLAKAAAENPLFAAHKERFAGCGQAAVRVKSFYESIPTTMSGIKGKGFPFRNSVATLTIMAGDGTMQLELLGVDGAVAIEPFTLAKLTTEEAAAMAKASQTLTPDTLMNLAWFFFAEGKPRPASVHLDLAEKQGADVAAARALMAVLARGAAEYDAERALLQLRAALEAKQWADCRVKLTLLRDFLRDTKVAASAAAELTAAENILTFEDDAFRSFAGTVVRTLRNHNGVTAAALSGDGRMAASCGADGQVKLWQTASGKESRAILAHMGSALSVAFSADNKMLASSGADKLVKVWDAVTGAEMQSLEGHAGAVTSVMFAADNKRILSGSEDMTLRVFVLGAVKELRVVKLQAAARGAVTVGDGRFAFCVSADGILRQWDLTTGGEKKKYEAVGVTCLACSSDARFAVTGGEDGGVKLWNLGGSGAARAMGAHDKAVTGAAFSPDGRFAATSAADGSVKLWDVAALRELRKLDAHMGAAKSVAFSGDGRFLLTAGADGELKLWKLWEGSQTGP